MVISGPGEYEVKGVRIIGISSFHDNDKGVIRGKNTVYFLEMEGISLIHCGDLGHSFTESDLEVVNGAAVLFIPVGGEYTISLPQVKEIITQVEPLFVIPMHYKTEKHNPTTFEKLNTLGFFLKEMGKEDIVPLPKLVLREGKLPTEQTIVVLEQKTSL